MSDAPSLPSIEDIVSNIRGPSEINPAPAPEPEVVVETPVEDAPATLEEAVAAASEEEAPVEVEEPAPEPAPKKESNLSKQFAVLSRREREIQQRQREIEAREAEIQKKLQEVQAPKSAAKPQSALDALKQLGYSYQDLTMEVLGQKEEKPVDPMQQRLDELSERLKKVDDLEAEQKRRWDEFENNQRKSVETQIRSSIIATAANNDDKYELLNTVGEEAFDLVYDVMSQYYEEKQALLTYEEACDIVEEFYEEKAKALASTRKIGQRSATTASPKPAVATKPSPVQNKASSKPTTLTQRHSTSAVVEPDVNKMTRDEAIAHLAKKIPMIQD